MGAPAEARQTLELVSENKRSDPILAAITTRLELVEQAADLGEVGDLEAKLAKNPADHQTRFDLALACNASDDRDKTVDHLLEIIKRDAQWNEGRGQNPAAAIV